MHEIAVASNLVEIACAEAAKVHALSITRVACRIGALCHIDTGVFREAFAMAATDTLCASATLYVVKDPVRARCLDCGDEHTVVDWDWECPKCGALGTFLGGGDELELTSLEVEVEDEDRSGQADPGTQRTRGRAEPREV